MQVRKTIKDKWEHAHFCCWCLMHPMCSVPLYLTQSQHSHAEAHCALHTLMPALCKMHTLQQNMHVTTFSITHCSAVCTLQNCTCVCTEIAQDVLQHSVAANICMSVPFNCNLTANNCIKQCKTGRQNCCLVQHKVEQFCTRTGGTCACWCCLQKQSPCAGQHGQRVHSLTSRFWPILTPFWYQIVGQSGVSHAPRSLGNVWQPESKCL